MRALDLCAGAGGWSLGLLAAGFDVVGVELDADACASHVANVGPCVRADLTAYHPDGAYAAVVGGVPCQPYSDAGKRGGLNDPRGRLFEHLARIAAEADARVVGLENVRGFTTWRDGDGVLVVRRVEEAFAARGFPHVFRALLCASHYGVPQRRRRVFMVGFRDGADAARFRWPAPSHGEPGNLLGLAPWVTVRQALGLSGAFRAGHLGHGGGFQGMRAVDVDAPGYTVGGRNNADLLARLDQPAPTVTAREQCSAIDFGSRGAVTRPRRAGDLLNPALGVLDRPAATVSAGGTEGGGGAEAFGNAEYRARLAAALEQASLLDRPATTVDTREVLAAAKRNGRKGSRQRAGAIDPLAESGLLDRPSTTVDTTNGVSPAGNHHRQKRAVRLTLAQLARLQDFPDGFVFVGNVGSQHRQVGNAVPPSLGAAVGRAIYAALAAARTEAA